MKRELEALLFATDSPLNLGRLKKIFAGVEAPEIRAAVKELQEEYETNGNAFDVVEFGGGWQIATRPEYSPVVEKLLKTRRFMRLSKAGLEVLAIIAYRQPLTRLEVDEIRGVNSSGAISTLTERNLITVVGRSQTVGNPLLYGTTREFLNHLGLKGLTQLPDLPDLEVIMEDRDELKEFASRVGRDVSDEELEDYFTAPEAADEAPVDEEEIPPVDLEDVPTEEGPAEPGAAPEEPAPEEPAGKADQAVEYSDDEEAGIDENEADDPEKTTDRDMSADHGQA